MNVFVRNAGASNGGTPVPTAGARDARPAGTPRVAIGDQLGTAAWMQPGQGPLRPWQSGDILLGSHQGQFIGTSDNRHILVAAGARSGKGSSFIIPNLCTYPGSVVVIDPKGENAIVAARRRAQGSPYCEGMGQRVLLLDPMDEIKTPDDDFSDLKACFNPLSIININSDDAVDDAFRIADALVVSTRSNDPMWEESARMLLQAVVLHVASSEDFHDKHRHLGTVYDLLMQGDLEALRLAAMAGQRPAVSPFGLLFRGMMRNKAFGGAVARLAAAFLHMEEHAAKTFVGVMANVRSNMSFLNSNRMRHCLSGSDFNLEELKTDPRGISLFISLPTRNQDTHFRWLRLMTTLVISEMERVRMRPKSGRSVLMILDEFTGLERMKVVENAAAQTAGFHLQFCFIVQNLSVLKEKYGDAWETFVANSGVKLFFCNDDLFTRDYASKLIGEREVVRETASRTGTSGQSYSRSVSESVSSTLGGSHSVSWSSAMARDGLSSGLTHSMGGSWSTTAGTTTTESFGTSSSQSRGVSETIHRRALVSPDEVGRLFSDSAKPKVLIIVGGWPASLDRTFYFRTPAFRGTYDRHPDHPRPLLLSQLGGVIAREKIEAERLRREKARLEQERRERLRKEEEAAERARVRDRELARIYAERRRDDEREERRLARLRRGGIALLAAATLVGVDWKFPSLLATFLIR